MYRIYIVEDSAILLRLLLEMLGGIPGAVVVGHAGRAEEAIVEIFDCTPDAIIVDLLLQSGTGFDVLKAVAHQGTQAPLAIVLTNWTMQTYRDRAAGLGAAYYFDKSTDILEMLRVVGELARKRKEQQGVGDSNRNDHSHFHDMNATTATAVEVCKVLDSLSALAMDLSCRCEVPPDTLILSAQKTRDACAAIDEAVSALKTILRISEAVGGGPIPTEVVNSLDVHGEK